jgi:hypothetical protein
MVNESRGTDKVGHLILGDRVKKEVYLSSEISISDATLYLYLLPSFPLSGSRMKRENPDPVLCHPNNYPKVLK